MLTRRIRRGLEGFALISPLEDVVTSLIRGGIRECAGAILAQASRDADEVCAKLDGIQLREIPQCVDAHIV